MAGDFDQRVLGDDVFSFATFSDHGLGCVAQHVGQNAHHSVTVKFCLQITQTQFTLESNDFRQLLALLFDRIQYPIIKFELFPPQFVDPGEIGQFSNDPVATLDTVIDPSQRARQINIQLFQPA